MGAGLTGSRHSHCPAASFPSTLLPEAVRVVGYVEFNPVTPSKRLGGGI
jgi:hypothetical protein